MTRLCECGCGTPAPLATVTDPERGLVRGKPQRFVHGHVGRLEGRRIRERLLAKVFVDLGAPPTVDDAPCWIWTGRTINGGYGQIGYNGRSVTVHRVAYELWFGFIPGSAPGGKRGDSDLVVDHLCRNRACVNPAHLEVVTQTVNILRGISPAAINAGKTHCDRGHEFTPGNTYVSLDGKRRECKACRLGDECLDYRSGWQNENRDRRNAERRVSRAEVGLGLAAITCTHGRSGYTSGCRCPECREANTAYERARRLARGVAGVGQR